MATHSLYPEQVIREAMELAAREQQGAGLDTNEMFDNYVGRHNPPKQSRTPAIWRTMHFCILGPTVQFDGTQWIAGSNLSSTCGDNDEVGPDADLRKAEEMEEVYPNAYVFDADLVDAAGQLYEVRVLYNEGWADHNTGSFGKVFDRLNTSRVYAEIISSGDCETTTFGTALVEGFAQHKDLEALEPYWRSDLKAKDQFSRMINLMRMMNEGNTGFSSVDGPRLERLMMKLLCKPGGAANSGYLAAQVLVEDPFTDMIAQFSAERYVSRTRGKDTSMEWYGEVIMGPFHASGLHQRGDLAGAVSALRDWEKNSFFNFENCFDCDEFLRLSRYEEVMGGANDGRIPTDSEIVTLFDSFTPLFLGLHKDELFCALVEEEIAEEKGRKRKAE